ncbi:MAG TPA: ROK family protein, partial [Chthoniobacteraceae bacterium]|nr:ROK family protein [Chthoniobacteraceae bacterium]
ETIRSLVGELGANLPVGISAPGLASPDRRSIAHLPGRLQGIEGLDWTTFLQHVELIPVSNDAQSALVGESWIGAARGLSDAILITLGTGVGGAILINGRILRGYMGRAGHLGHLCLDPEGPRSIVGMPGALECWIGNFNVGERSSGRFATTHELIAAYREGDEFAREVWIRSIKALACAIGSLINTLDPQAVIIGGGIAQAGDALFGPLGSELTRVEWRPGGYTVDIRSAQLGEWAGAIGAARTALEITAE